MKDAVTLLLCAVALAHGLNQSPVDLSRCHCDPSEAEQICLANYDKDNVLIAHENCNQFYKCVYGKPVPFFCPTNLLYDPVSETCEWPKDFDCGNRPIVEYPVKEEDSGTDDESDVDNDWTCNCNPNEAPTICATEGSNGILVAHQNCDQFYKCAEGRPVTFDCPPTLLYNPYKEECDWPVNVECGDRGISDPKEEDSSDEDSDEDDVTCNCNPEEAPTICAAPGSDGELIAHENCNKYYICNHGLPVAAACVGNLLFNPYTRQCDWPRNVECGDRLVPEIECAGCNDNAGNDANCDDDDSVNNPDVTNPATNPPGNNCDPNEAPAICAADDSQGVLVAHENCNQFYTCSGGKPVVLTCPQSLLFNPAKDQCDWPKNVDCGDRVIPDPNDSVPNPGVTNPGENNPGITNPATNPPGNNCDPSEAPAICAADDSQGILVAHENCNQFYTCSGGKPVVLTCPQNLLFNPAKDQCDWPENVECGDRVIPDPEAADSSSFEIHPPSDHVEVPPQLPVACNCNPQEAPSICAANNSSGILVAHENCNQFYKCDHGKPVALICYGNLLYNPYTEQCDWPENVDCGDRVIPDPNDSVTSPGVTSPSESSPGVTNPPGNNCDPSEAPAICAANDSEGVLVAHENCNQIYICSGGKPVVLTCPPNLLFNPAKDQCDWSWNVDCGDRVIPDPNDSVPNPGVTNPGENNPGITNPATNPPGNNCDPSEAPAICAADDSEGVLVAHENCNQFYICSGGKPVVQTCPPNLLFNPAKDQCDWSWNVDCGDRVIPDPNDSVPNPGVTNPGENNPGITNPATNPPGNNCDPSEAPAICATDDSEGVLVAHENCNQFYICSGGKPVVLTCPPNLLFNPAKDQCDWPWNVDCGDRVIPDPEAADSSSSEIHPPSDDVVVPPQLPVTCNCNPQEAPSICAADNSSGILVAHENCNQFYKCDHGKPITLNCNANLLYNPYTEQCDWPENVDCGDRVIPDPNDSVTSPGVTIPSESSPGVTNPPGNNCDPSEAPAICAADDSDGILVAHENCNQFYKCSEGKPVALTCPANLLFNPNKDQCDWSFNVNCGDRVIPIPEDSDSDTTEIRPPSNVVPIPPVENINTDSSGNSKENAGQCNCDPDQAPSICAGDKTDGILIAHENCNQFYKCDNGRPVPFRCPKNTLYDPVSQECDWVFNVECGDRIIPDPEDSVSDSGEDDSEEEVTVGPCNCNPEEAPAICAVNDSSGVKIAHENCNQFYICDHGEAVALTCNRFLLYNPYTERCDWPENVQCGDRVIPEPGSESDESDDDCIEENISNPNDDPSQAPTICAGDGSEGVLVAHEYCDQYYICSGGVPVSRPCNNGLLFNPNNERCDWPRNVICGDRIVPDDCICDTRNPKNAPIMCANTGSQGKLIAHENCNQFYICSNSVPVPQICPTSLLYNPDKEFCDLPQNVNCENRLVSYASLNKHVQSRQTLRK